MKHAEVMYLQNFIDKLMFAVERVLHEVQYPAS